MLTRRLGRTEHESSLAVLGAAAFALATPEVAEAAFIAALAAGVNHLDIAPRYGRAQTLVGPLVPAVRRRLFVGCKTTRANPDGVRAQFEESLTLLGCDAFDLYQLHAVTDVDELDRRALAAETILRMRDEGLCRFVGVTGHGLGTPAAQAEAVRRYDLDTVMFPVFPRMWSHEQYRRDAEALLALCVARDVGVMAIKAAAARPWRDPPDERHASTWYEPYHRHEEIERGVRFALSTAGVQGFCTPGDLDLLAVALEAAAAFEAMSPAEWESAIDEVAHEEPIFPMPTG